MRQKKHKGNFIFKSDAYDAGFKAGQKAAQQDMAGRNKVLTAKERLKQLPQWVKVLIKENNLRVDHTLEVEINEEPSFDFLGNAAEARAFVEDNRGAVVFSVKGVRKK